MTATANEIPGHSYLYRVELQCKLEKEGVCAIPITCAAPPNTFLANVFRSVDGRGFEPYGIECLTHAEAVAAQQPVLTPGMIEKAFQRLDWPASSVVVQPPGGRTLVNLPTILHTENTTATAQTVTLLGQAITIRARPAHYTWHFGDGTSTTTTSPGHAYPGRGYHDVTHTYTRKARGVVLSVDTEYVGEYRLDSGPWVQIPEPRTIPGPPVAISIDTATPHLVAGD